MPNSIEVKNSFVCAHRLVLDYQGVCQPLHGHQINVVTKFSAKQNNQGNMVADFDIVFKELENWLKANWDHNLLLSSTDKELGQAVSNITGQNVFYFTGNPTAENMAENFYKLAAKPLADKLGLKLEEVKIIETDKYTASYNA